MNELFTDFRVTDALDILVVAYAIYRALLIIRGTRAVQVLVGLVAILLLYALSTSLELNTVNWVLEEFSIWFVLAVIILFQDDIRRALARLGTTGFGRSGGGDELSVYHRIGRACFRLADQGHGAIVVLERQGSLEELRRDAILVDAALSVELLVSIFQPSTPIHDGAVILRKGRLWLAGAFLPLTKREDLPRHLGTRHRAAIGQSEITDSMIFTVSEERRAVTIAFRGELHPVDTPDELRLKVQQLLSWEEQVTEEGSVGLVTSSSLSPVQGPIPGSQEASK